MKECVKDKSRIGSLGKTVLEKKPDDVEGRGHVDEDSRQKKRRIVFTATSREREYFGGLGK